MVTHDARIAGMARRVLFMKDGRIIDQGAVQGGKAGGADWVTARIRQLT
jgi:ABC-type lipoprotein export system ATPase subunit